MTLEQLKTLAAVAETGSFQAASEKLYKSRPALSIAIKNLEEEMGFEIFSRDTYRPELTAKGKAFHEKAQRVLDQADHLSILGEHLALGHEAKITIAVNAICPLLSVMTIIHLFQDSHPHTKLNLKIEYGSGALEELYAGKADLAVTELPNPDPNLEAINWSTIRFLPVAAPSFPLAEYKHELNYEELSEFVRIIVGENTEHPQKFFAQNKTTGEYWTVSDYYVKKQMLLSSLGWGIMPMHLIQKDLHAGSLVPLRIKTLKQINVETYLLRKTNMEVGPVAQEIWKSLQ
ncbi:MAG: LysR family transcriptional regulator [SAR324 cluster bacterium]|nr:LysR family transcriptional regulator [SAR324 cluster bacterium]